MSLSDHPYHVRFRVRAGVAEEGAVDSGPAVRHQLCGEPNIHTDPVRAEELATGSHRHRDRLGDDHLDGGGRVEALQMGRRGTGALLRLGVDSERAAIVDHVLELGPMIK